MVTCEEELTGCVERELSKCIIPRRALRRASSRAARTRSFLRFSSCNSCNRASAARVLTPFLRAIFIALSRPDVSAYLAVAMARSNASCAALDPAGDPSTPIGVPDGEGEGEEKVG